MLADWGDVPGVTINRFCASGIDAVAQAAARIRGHDVERVAPGGVERVSRVPMFSDGGPLFCDPATVSKVGSVFMGIYADLVATREGYQRDELDACGLETQRKAARAWDEGFFDRSLVPFTRPDGVVIAGRAPAAGHHPGDAGGARRPSPSRGPRGRTPSRSRPGAAGRAAGTEPSG